jgi:hypothetical protein
MSAKTRQAQHRPERESARSKELNEARQQVKQLKKLVARLQKTIRKYETERGIALIIEQGDPEPVMAEAEPAPAPVPAPDPTRCDCGSNSFITFKTPSGKTLIRCKACKSSF